MIARMQREEAEFRTRLASYGRENKDYWSFRGNAARRHGHAYFQYPAMMVPQMVGDLLDATLQTWPRIERVYDPFVGSGTALTETVLRGLDFTGKDVNPLAILLCRAKTIPHFVKALEEKSIELVDRIRSDRSRSIQCSLRPAARRKWFENGVATALTRIRRGIRSVQPIWARRFFWVALAETVRLTSNSRTSTFKLHIRQTEEIKLTTLSPARTFAAVVRRNIQHLREQRDCLKKKGYVHNGRYRGSVDLNLGTCGKTDAERSGTCDLLITSPPYGDNATTIPYGQHAYLPLQWIDLEDIDCIATGDFLTSTHEIDRRSLGGSRRLAVEDQSEIALRSATYAKTVLRLQKELRDRAARVTAFCRDLNRCLDPILSMMKPGAVLIWVVGNRRIAGRHVPLDEILTELLLTRGVSEIANVKRRIPSKRMAVRNNIARTMGRETILVFRKGKA